VRIADLRGEEFEEADAGAVTGSGYQNGQSGRAGRGKRDKSIHGWTFGVT
jgi:hypothetical protein